MTIFRCKNCDIFLTFASVNYLKMGVRGYKIHGSVIMNTFSLCTVHLYFQSFPIFEPRCEKTGLLGFLPGPTQTRLCNHTRWLEA